MDAPGIIGAADAGAGAAPPAAGGTGADPEAATVPAALGTAGALVGTGASGVPAAGTGPPPTAPPGTLGAVGTPVAKATSTRDDAPAGGPGWTPAAGLVAGGGIGKAGCGSTTDGTGWLVAVATVADGAVTGVCGADGAAGTAGAGACSAKRICGPADWTSSFMVAPAASSVGSSRLSRCPAISTCVPPPGAGPSTLPSSTCPACSASACSAELRAAVTSWGSWLGIDTAHAPAAPCGRARLAQPAASADSPRFGNLTSPNRRGAKFRAGC